MTIKIGKLDNPSHIDNNLASGIGGIKNAPMFLSWFNRTFDLDLKFGTEAAHVKKLVNQEVNPQNERAVMAGYKFLGQAYQALEDSGTKVNSVRYFGSLQKAINFLDIYKNRNRIKKSLEKSEDKTVSNNVLRKEIENLIDRRDGESIQDIISYVELNEILTQLEKE